MTTTIREILKLEGLKGEDIRIKLNNKELKLNEEILLKDELDSLQISEYFEVGLFVFKNIEFFNKIKFLSVVEMFTCDIPFVNNYLQNYKLLKISKKLSVVIKVC